MQGVSIIIPVFNKAEVTMKCINYIREFNKKNTYEIIVIDNGSTDNTPELLSKDEGLVYIREQKNIGISKAYNNASKIAKNNIFCFMHNDVFIFEKGWAVKIKDFLLRTRDAGITGFYGAKRIRKDGSFRGKTIVHSKKGSSLMRKSFEKIAAVDGLLIAVQKSVFEKTGGFNEDFPIHYYDKDISLKSLKHGYCNYALSVPFEHLGATRKGVTEENEIRDESQKKFIKIWSEFLPVDVSTLREKFLYAFRSRQQQTQ